MMPTTTPMMPMTATADEPRRCVMLRAFTAVTATHCDSHRIMVRLPS